MSMQDPIADMLTRIRNACHALKATVKMPSSKLKLSILKVLKDEGYVRDYTVSEDKVGIVEVSLKYTEDRSPVIHRLDRVSKPGLRVYHAVEDIPKVMHGLGVAIVSTSKGLMTDREARQKNIGGEVLCFVE